MELLLDNYKGIDVKELNIKDANECKKILKQYLSEHDDNFVSIRGSSKSFTIELGSDGGYQVFETVVPSNRLSFDLEVAIKYAMDNANKN